MTPKPPHLWLYIAAAVVVISSAVALRTPCLSADPPHGLSASRAEYTDEGLKFYQARNRVLFGQWRLDIPWAMQGHLRNSPVPTLLGWGVFELFGVGRVQARLISVSAGILSCAVLILIGFRSRRPETGILAGAFAAVSYILVSYDRLALFESLFVLLLLCAALFYLDCGWRRWVLTPVFLILAYFTRASAAVLALAFLAAFLTEAFRAQSANAARKAFLVALAVVLLSCAALAVWLLPGNQIAAQIRERFATPYFRVFPPLVAAADLCVRTSAASLLSVYMPIVTILALLALSPALLRPDASGRCPRLLFFWWFVAVFSLVAFLEYRPTRYYTLMVPAIAFLAADWIVTFVKGESGVKLAAPGICVWVLVRFAALTQVAGVLLRCLVAKRHEFPLFIDVDAARLTAFKDFVESNFIGTVGVLQPRDSEEASLLSCAMRRHVFSLVLLALVLLVLGVAWLAIRRRFFPAGFSPRVRLVTGVMLALLILVGQGGLVLDSLSRKSRRYQVRSAENAIRRTIGDNPRACVAGNWAPALCMGTPYFTMPFARGNGNAWDTFRRFPVTHFVLELDSVNEDVYLARQYPAEFARCRLVETFDVDFYRIGLFEYSPPDGAPRPPWPFEKRQTQ